MLQANTEVVISLLCAGKCKADTPSITPHSIVEAIGF